MRQDLPRPRHRRRRRQCRSLPAALPGRMPRPGVLLYAAEDAGHVVRQRLQGIAAAADVHFDDLDIAVIDTPVLRLDRKADQAKLAATVDQARPRILILDPLVRLHGVDENAVGEIAPILAYGNQMFM